MALLAMLLAPPAGAKEKKEAPPPPVRTQATIAQQGGDAVKVSATILAVRQGAAAARVAGLVDSVAVRAGDRVARGQTLASLDDAEARRQFAIKLAEREEANARLEKARSDLKRDRELIARKTISASRLIESEAELAIRQALLKRADAELALARDALNWLTITAPYDAVVTQRLAQPGAWIDQGDAVAQLLDPNDLEARAAMPEAMARGLQPGATAQLTFSGDGKRWPITLRAAPPSSDPVSRNRMTWWKLPEGAPAVAGQEALITFTVGAAEGILVPKDAIIRKGGKASVFVVGADNTVQPKAVALGRSVGGYFQALEGLAIGETVVVRGNERLRPGQTVNPAPLEADAAEEVKP
ncbi:putative efflux transporter [Magnetofaba australis IT-1]|uniref:Putative efflux transporter n=2 Tax=Magnetofaba TaxID=1472292 RepID=A0A1Y2KAT9_9PROT|nr:putative efflux transporter [Magnetofaba australis IT-1]